MNYYDKINWKNRSEGKTTKISAERLNHMDNQIFNNANAIGNVEKIADIGDGTLCGAAETLKETAEKLNQSLTQLFTFENINILSDYFTSAVKLLDSRAYREGNHVRMEVRFNLEASLSHTMPLFYINGKFAPKTKTSIIVGSINMNKTAYVVVTGRLDSTIGYYVFNQTGTETLEPGLYYVSIDYSLLA